MTMQTRNLGLALALATLSVPALASDGPSYSYADLGYVDSDIGISGDGFQLRGSYAVNDAFFLFGQYSDTSYDNFFDLGVGELRLGFGWHTPMSDRADFVAALNFERVDIDTSVGSADDTGFGLKLGVRGKLSDALEVNTHVRHANYGQGASDTLFGIGGAFALNDRFSVVLEIEQGDSDTLMLGARWGF
jgi:hypothetical protein